EQVSENKGAQLFANLKNKAEDLPFSFGPPSSTAWFASFRQTVVLDDLDKVAVDEDRNPISPGPFRGELDAFDLGRTPDISAFSSIKEFRGLVKILAGVRVYRDGFGIRVDR